MHSLCKRYSTNPLAQSHENTINVALVQFLNRLHAKYGNEKQRLLLRSLKNFLHWKPIKTFNLLL